jgi:hypothetical protein
MTFVQPEPLSDPDDNDLTENVAVGEVLPSKDTAIFPSHCRHFRNVLFIMLIQLPSLTTLLPPHQLSGVAFNQFAHWYAPGATPSR